MSVTSGMPATLARSQPALGQRSPQVNEIFDAISYAKGACAIHMLVAFLGEAAFRDGMRLCAPLLPVSLCCQAPHGHELMPRRQQLSHAGTAKASEADREPAAVCILDGKRKLLLPGLAARARASIHGLIFGGPVSRYVQRHKWGNAGTRDLWAALGESSGKPVEEIMGCWTAQTGYPVVKVRLADDEPCPPAPGIGARSATEPRDCAWGCRSRRGCRTLCLP